MKKLAEMAEVVREVEEGDAGRRGEQVEGTEPNLEKSEPTLRTADVVPRTNYTTGCQTSLVGVPLPRGDTSLPATTTYERTTQHRDYPTVHQH